MSKRLLIETRMNSLALNESKSRQVHPGCLGTLDGPCADFKNATRNGNFYSRRLWENVFQDPIVKESLEDRILIGELDHPGDRLETKAVNACIVMTGYEFDDKQGLLLGTFDILDTPNGRILKSLLDYGCKIGVSSRGEGDVVTTEGIDNVDEDSYNFMGFDAVVLPAVKAAKPGLRESLDRAESKTLRESLAQQVNEATTMAELDLIKRVVEAMDLPDSDSLTESVNNKAQELTEGTTGSSNLLEDLEKANGQISELTTTVSKLKEELTTCKSRIGKLMRSRQKLVSELTIQKKRVEEISSEYSCSVIESSDRSRKVEALQASLRDATETIEGLRQQIRTTDSDSVKTESRIRGLEESLRKAQELAQEKINEVKVLTTKIEGLKASSRKKLSESSSRDSQLRESLSKVKTSLQESQKLHNAFVKSYIEDRCKSFGLDPVIVLESVKSGMDKKSIDLLVESLLERSDRYKSLTFRQDPLLNSLDKGSVSFSGRQLRVSEEDQQTADFMSEVNKLF